MSAVAVADPGPMARFEAVKADASMARVVFQRVSEGETLKDIAKEWQVPRGLFVEWFTTEHAGLYDAALKVRADELAHEALAIADEQKEATDAKGNRFDPEVPRDTLRVKTRMQLLEKWDRARYGTKDEKGGGGGITVVVDRSCGGAVAIQAGDAKVLIAGEAGGVQNERVISSAEASHVATGA